MRKLDTARRICGVKRSGGLRSANLKHQQFAMIALLVRTAHPSAVFVLRPRFAQSVPPAMRTASERKNVDPKECAKDFWHQMTDIAHHHGD